MMRHSPSDSLASGLGLTLAALAALTLLFTPASAEAFCGFFVSGADAKLYNNASQVALMRQGMRTTLSMSNNYLGPPEDFALVVPVPVVLKEADVKTLDAGVFQRLDQLTAPRLVEYWEQDPCAQPLPPPAPSAAGRGGAVRAARSRNGGGLGVTVEAQFTVGEYQIVILSARDSSGLDTWLRINRYKIPAGAEVALRPYVRERMKFFVAKVDIKKVKRDAHGTVVLSPLRFHYDSPSFRLPVRLGLLNAKQKQDLLIYVLHPSSRFETANYPNAFIPTNIEVTDAIRDRFGEFFVSLYDAVQARHAGRAVVTEYSWQSSSCDPCPVPPLSFSDLVTLGYGTHELASPSGPAGGAAPPGRFRGRGRWFGGGPGMVLTRLHARYDRHTLFDDLVFKEAPPVLGGRAQWGGQDADHGAQVQPSGSNNFQGRYIIRHEWTGPITCSNPVRGRWGGPPGQGTLNLATGAPRPARDLANARRGTLVLPQVLRSDIPELGVRAGKPRRRP